MSLGHKYDALLQGQFEAATATAASGGVVPGGVLGRRGVAGATATAAAGSGTGGGVVPGGVRGAYPLGYGLGVGATGVPITTVGPGGRVTQTRVGPNTVTQRTSGPGGSSSTSIAAPGVGRGGLGYGAGLGSVPFYTP